MRDTDSRQCKIACPHTSLADGTSFYPSLGEMLYDGDDRVRCHLCGRWMRAVAGTHLRWHGWPIAGYREAFQLDQETPTCAQGISARLARAAKLAAVQRSRYLRRVDRSATRASSARVARYWL